MGGGDPNYESIFGGLSICIHVTYNIHTYIHTTCTYILLDSPERKLSRKRKRIGSVETANVTSFINASQVAQEQMNNHIPLVRSTSHVLKRHKAFGYERDASHFT